MPEHITKNLITTMVFWTFDVLILRNCRKSNFKKVTRVVFWASNVMNLRNCCKFDARKYYQEFSHSSFATATFPQQYCHNSFATATLLQHICHIICATSISPQQLCHNSFATASGCFWLLLVLAVQFKNRKKMRSRFNYNSFYKNVNFEPFLFQHRVTPTAGSI